VVRGPLTMASIIAALAVALPAGGRVDTSTDPSPAGATAGSTAVRHFEYVFPDGAIDIYDVDHGNQLLQRVAMPQISGVRGVIMSPVTGTLYVAYGGQGGDTGSGSMVAFDLLSLKMIWRQDYDTGVDSIAITPTGLTIYLPVGEASHSGVWQLVNARTGEVTGAIHAGEGAHNTVMSLDGKHVYLAGVDQPFLAVASTTTNKVEKRIGPLRTGGRPFTINGAQTLAFTTAENLLGFQVSSIETGKVLYTVRVPGFSWDPHTWSGSPSHGIALSPDERRLYVVDSPSGYVHVFDVSRLPASRPRHLADIKLHHPPLNSSSWLQPSRNGRYLYVGRSGDVIDTTKRAVVAFLPPLQTTGDCLEIDWSNGRPIGTTTRYGLGYVRPRR
jgi:DNA-binding beta-propeller fold protein YncE